MDYHLLALIEQSSDSDLSFGGEYSAVIPVFQEIQTKGPLSNQAKFKDRIFTAGSQCSARLTGNPELTGSLGQSRLRLPLNQQLQNLSSPNL